MNTVKLALNTVSKQIVGAYPLNAKVADTADITIVEKTVYGPTAYNRFIVDGRYVAKSVVEQIWVALENGAAAVAVKKERAARKPRLVVTKEDVKGFTQGGAVSDANECSTKDMSTGGAEDLRTTKAAMEAAVIPPAEPSLEALLTASIAANLKVAA